MDMLSANDRIGQYPKSWYADTADFLDEFAPARGALRCDVCVVGGGFMGLSSALHLAEAGFDVVLVDAHRVGWGASGRNGGQVGSGQRLDQDALETLVGTAQAHQLWEMALESLNIVKSLIDKHKIDCDYHPGIIHADHRKRFVAHSHAYAEKLNRDYDYHLIQPLDQQQIRGLVGSHNYYGGTLDLGGGHLHPLNFSLGLAGAARAAGVRIFERSRVQAIQEGAPAEVKTDAAQISADFVVLGCNGYVGNLKARIARRVMPINNFIVATEPLSPEAARALIRDNRAVADSRFVINYFRLSDDNRLLFGGGESYGFRFPRDIAALVRKPMLEIYPQLKNTAIDYSWGGTLGITLNRMPHFERLRANILTAGGFSGHGVALATLAGKLMADAINGQAGAFDVMASVPTRKFPGGVALRWPLLVLAMTWFSLRDRL